MTADTKTTVKTSTQRRLDELEALAENAEKSLMAARRKGAPGGTLGTSRQIPSEELARIACPEAYWQGPIDRRSRDKKHGSKPPTRHAFWGLLSKAKQYAMQAAKPTRMDGNEVTHPKDETLILFDMPRELHDAKVSQEAAESAAMLPDGGRVNLPEDNNEDVQGHIDEELRVTKGSGG